MLVLLTGFMGSGKSAVGRRLAAALGVRFVDLDEEVEHAAGRTVRQIFDELGEAAFRQLEHQALARLVEERDAVIATGGGTLTFAANRDLVAGRGLVVWLNPSFATIVGRIGGRGKKDRPLFRDEAQAFALYRERLPAYQAADLRLDVGAEESADQVAARLALLLGQRSCAT
jgi:shikimate kinase